MTSKTDLVAIFGLLEPKILKEFNEKPVKTYALGQFKVEEGLEAARFICNCGRSKPYILAVEDLGKIYPASGSFSCSVCAEENKLATSPSDKIAAWLSQNRIYITTEQHLHLPKEFQRLFDKENSKTMRPRRFIYTKFYGVTLGKQQKILCTCGDESCFNPYHMMVAASAATKVTPDMKKDVQLWFSKNVSPRVVQQMLKIKYNHSLSLKTITNLKKSLPA